MSAATPSLKVACPRCHVTVRVPAGRWAEGPRCPRCSQVVLGGEPLELDDAHFDEHLERDEVPLVVDFWAPWCGPCRMMGPQFADAAQRSAIPMQFAKLNVDENPRVAGRLRVSSIPTTVLFSGGREVARLSGVRPAREILAWIDSHRQ